MSSRNSSSSAAAAAATSNGGGKASSSGGRGRSVLFDEEPTERTASPTERTERYYDEDHSSSNNDELVSLKSAMEDRFASLEAKLSLVGGRSAAGQNDSGGILPDYEASSSATTTVEARFADLESQLQQSRLELSAVNQSNAALQQSNRELKEKLEQGDVAVKEELRKSLMNQFSQQFSALATQSDQPAEHTFSEDAYSFLFCSPVCSGTYWIGMTIVFLQFGIFTLFLLDLLSTQEIPPNVEPIVRIAQFIAVFVTFIAQTDIRTSLRALIYREGVEEADEAFGQHGFTLFKFLFANILMLVQGIIGVIVAISLIVLTDNVFDLLLNFTAIMFVSELDELVFAMATLGYVGRSAEHLAKEISATTFQERNVKGWTKYLHIYAFMLLVAIGYGTHATIIARQANDEMLAQYIKVQFGDAQDPDLGLYSGCYKMKSNSGWSSRVDYLPLQAGRGEGRFKYCVNDDVRTWIFTRLDVTNDPCQNPYLRSADKKPTSFDVLDTKDDQWLLQSGNPISDYQLSEVQDDKMDLECGDEFVLAGQTAETQAELCPILTMDATLNGFSEDRDWSRNFETLLQDNGQDGGSPVVVSYYQHPVYVGEFTDEKDGLELMFFTGRRWVLTGAKSLLPQDDDTTDPSNKEAMIALLQSQDFDLLKLPSGTIKFASEAVSFATDRGTPLGLRWFFTRYSSEGNSASFPFADVSRPSDAMFGCGKCDAISNPCRYEGVCRDDGTCDCKHGATGKLCDIKPLANGVCNQYFNRGPDGYDGGDCCVATCPLVSCGIGDVIAAFEQELQLAGNGFPNCTDPAMVPLTIHMNSTISELFQGANSQFSDASFTGYTIQVKCGDDVPLRVVLDPWLQGEFTETLYLADQTKSCTLSFLGIQSDSELNITYRLLDESVATADGLAATMGDPLTVTFDNSFEVPGLYSRCLKETLEEVIQVEELYSGSYKDEAVAFLDNEISPGVEYCGEEQWLTERYALAATSFAEVAPEPWIDSNDHCLWSRVTCRNSRPVILTYGKRATRVQF